MKNKYFAEFSISIPFLEKVKTKKEAEKALCSLFQDLKLILEEGGRFGYASDSKVDYTLIEIHRSEVLKNE